MKQLLKTTLWIIVLLLSIVNFSLSVYILQQKVLNDKKLLDDPLNCFADLSEGAHGCATVQTSVYATTLGIPNPVYGIMFFAFLILISLYFLSRPKISEQTQELWFFAILSFTCGGALFSVWLLYVQYFILKATCIYCLWVDGIMMSLAILIWFAQDIFEIKKE